MAAILAGIDDEFVVRRTRLPRFTPFPSWNGVVTCNSSRGLISIISECGNVSVLRLNDATQQASLEVVQILESDHVGVMNMCQVWTPSGRWLVVSRDCALTVYGLRDELLHAVAHTSLRFAGTALDAIDDGPKGLLLVVGSTAGVTFYSISTTSEEDGGAFHVSLIRSALDDVAVSIVKFSPNAETLAIGTVDGRVAFVPRCSASGDTISDRYGATSAPGVFTKVLTAPRVTSISFAPTGDKAVVTTRKGNVYVFTTAEALSQWVLDDTFESLVANPKGGAAFQTLATWWATTKSATPIFVIVGRLPHCAVELVDVCSQSILHTLRLVNVASSSPMDISSVPVAGNDLHIVGVACVPATNDEEPPRLLCVDSDATISMITWPFLELVCHVSE